VDYSEDSFNDAQVGLDRFYSTLKAIKDEVGRGPSPSKGEVGIAHNRGAGEGSFILIEARQNIESFRARFEEAMDDDFNTAQALGYFYDLQRHLNSLLDISKAQPTQEIISMLNQGLDLFLKTGWVFGLFREDPEQYLARQRKEGLNKLNLTDEEILRSIGERNLARKEKNYKKADEIRNSLLSKGIVLEDNPSGTTWKIK
jgi:cysteinyl-tRNA synthetase